MVPWPAIVNGSSNGCTKVYLFCFDIFEALTNA